MTTVNDASEIMKVRRMLGDAGEKVSMMIQNELVQSTSASTVFTRYGPIFDVSGVWVSVDPDHEGTDYYGTGSFNSYTREITLQNSLPGVNTLVLINYTYFKGLPDEAVDELITGAKTYVERYTNRTYNWTTDTDHDTVVAISAMLYRTAIGCLLYQVAADILQKGWNFAIEEFRIETKTWGGGMPVGDLLIGWQKHVDEHINILGRYWYYAAPSSSYLGRTAHGYRMDDQGRIS